MARGAALLFFLCAASTRGSLGSRVKIESRSEEAHQLSQTQGINPAKTLLPLLAFSKFRKRAFQRTLFEEGLETLTTLTHPISGAIFPESRADNLPEDWTWNVKNLVPIARSDSGSTVFKGTLVGDPGKQVIAKRIALADEEGVVRAKREIEIMEMFQGQAGFVTMYKTSNTTEVSAGEEVYILMESAVGTLKDQVVGRPYEEVGLGTRWRLFAEIVRAVRDMKRQGIVHRDLKPENILIVGDASHPDKVNAAICDFGSACSLPGGRWPCRKVVGTPAFIAPEAWEEGEPNSARDVWALGILLYQMLFTELPGPLNLLHRAEAIKGAIRTVRLANDWTVQEMKRLGPEIGQLLERMLDPSPLTRISIEDALEQVEAFASKFYINTVPELMPSQELVWLVSKPPSGLKAVFRGWVDAHPVA